ncbi:MAG: hypothetical protein PHV34_15050 [Verrucomicrobiae bacterium]|nr:hypothetical protein [Verrucomicrobiae bacterium]
MRGNRPLRAMAYSMDWRLVVAGVEKIKETANQQKADASHFSICFYLPILPSFPQMRESRLPP